MFGLQLALAILPCTAIVYLIYKADLYEKEDIFPLLICFLLGVIITFPLFELQALFNRLGWLESGTLITALISSFILVSFTEESLKFLSLRLYPYRRSFFTEPIDGIVYSTTIAMGFAMLENIFYAYQYELSTTLVRGVTAVPAHASFAAIMGYFVGRARFNPGKRRRFMLLGLILPIAIHGLYDFFIIQEVYDGLIILSVLTLSAALFFSIRLVREQQASSPYRDQGKIIREEGEEA